MWCSSDKRGLGGGGGGGSGKVFYPFHDVHGDEDIPGDKVTGARSVKKNLKPLGF